MNTLTKAVIVVIIIIILGSVIYLAFTPSISNCDPTVAYTQTDSITGTTQDGITQCYCPTDTTDSNGNPLAAWVAQNNTQYYFCVYAVSP